MAERRLAASSRPDGECVVWTAHVQTRGYGELTLLGMKWLAHRLAWVLARGPIPDGLTIDHRCRNKRCVNVAHLELVTRAENTRRQRQLEAARRTAEVSR